MIDGAHIGQIDNVINRAVSRIQRLQILRRNQIGFSCIVSPLPMPSACRLQSANQLAIPIHITGGGDREPELS